MEISEINYPDMNSIAYWLRDEQIPEGMPLWKWLRRTTINDRIVNKTIYWEHKRDGSNLGLYLDGGGTLQCRTRNSIYAHESVRKRFLALPFVQNIDFALQEASKLRVNLVIFGEYLERGTSPARFEHHETDDFQAFDVWNDSIKRWMPYEVKSSFFKKYGIPQVELFGVTTHGSVVEILDYKDKILREQGLGKEGTVGKVYLPNGYINFFKEKHEDKPRVKKERVEDPREELPDSEVFGAINKAYLELGQEQFVDPRIAMPLIAKLIEHECDKHGCKMSRKPIIFYKKKLEDLARK